jgi:hypothetical protein
LRIVLCLELGLVDSDQFLALARVLAKAVVGNPIKPGREFCLAAKAADVSVSAQESFLGEIVRQREIVARELAQQTAHGRLMIANELGKSVVIIIDKDAGDEVGIGERHVSRLHRGGRLLAVHVQPPHE